MKWKIFLLAIPVIVLLYVFLLRDRLERGDSIGGGSYDLTKLYTVCFAGIYLFVLNIFFLIQDASTNRLLLLVGALTFLFTVFMFSKML